MSQSTPPFKCALCNDYAGSESQVRAHIQGKADDNHRGIGFATADEYIVENGSDVSDVDPPGGDAGGSDDGDGEGGSSGPQPNDPAMPEKNDGDGGGGDLPDCPDCGSELKPADELGDEWQLEYSETDYACLACGGEFVDG